MRSTTTSPEPQNPQLPSGIGYAGPSLRLVYDLMIVLVYLRKEYGLRVDYKALVTNTIPGVRIRHFADETVLVIDDDEVFLLRELLPQLHRSVEA
jgi:hypothetical protein